MHRRIMASMLAATSVAAIALATLQSADARPQRGDAQAAQTGAYPTAQRQAKEIKRRGKQARRSTSLAEESASSGGRQTPATRSMRRKVTPAATFFWQPEASRYAGSATRRTSRTSRTARTRRPDTRENLMRHEITAPNNFPIPAAHSSSRPVKAVHRTRRNEAVITRRTAPTARPPRQEVRAPVTQGAPTAPPNFPVRRATVTAPTHPQQAATRNERIAARPTARALRIRQLDARAYAARRQTTAPPNFPTSNEGYFEAPTTTAARNRAVARSHYAYAYAGGGSSDLVAEARRWIGTNPTSRRTLWCATFLNFVLERTGRRGTGSDMARSFASYGRRISGPQVGAIAVLSRGPRGGHVGIVSGVDEDGNPILISGNHNNQVDEAPYPRGRVRVYVVPHS